MKKNLLFLFVSFFLAITSNAQERMSVQEQPLSAGKGVPASNVPPCFCCDPIAFQLPNPPQIIGASTPPLCACDVIKFSTPPCPGATFTWSVKDNNNIVITFSGQGTNAIVLNYSLAQQLAGVPPATSLIVTLKVCCGHNCVSNTLQVKLKPIPSTNFSYSINDDGNGGYTVTATATGTPLPALSANVWYLQLAPCPINPCDYGTGTIKWWAYCVGTFNVPNGKLVKPNCYRLIHYVNVCSTACLGSNCWIYYVKCFQLADKSMMNSGNADGPAKACTPEMVREIEMLRNQKPENLQK